jgi:hypothetical protein
MNLGAFPLGSARSRAAARVTLGAKLKKEAEDSWDKPLDGQGLAEAIRAGRLKAEERRARGRPAYEDRGPIVIPPGKENTEQGRLAARINAARERMRQHETR